MRIAFLLVRQEVGKVSPVIPEVVRLLTDFGATVDVIYPDDDREDPARDRVDHDLYVLKARTPSALDYAAAMHSRGAKTVNPYPVTALCRDKLATTQALAAAGVPVPETFADQDPTDLIPQLDAGPLVMKPYRGSQGRGVHVVRTVADVLTLSASEGSEPVMAQRYHEPDGLDRKLYRIGTDYFCVNRVWPPSTYADKLGEVVPVDEELRNVAERCGEALGIDLYGVDVVISQGQPYVVDLSSFPGFKGVPDAAMRLADYLYEAAT